MPLSGKELLIEVGPWNYSEFNEISYHIAKVLITDPPMDISLMKDLNLENES